MNKRRSARILVAVLALLAGSAAAWSGCLRADAGAMAASHAAHAVPAHCEETKVHHPGCAHAGPLCVADHPALAGGALPGETFNNKADKSGPDFHPPPGALLGAWIPPPRESTTSERSGVIPPWVPTTLFDLRMLLLD
ncbi:MAG: hypothetical protein ACOY42_09030 [Pseudomonadota bacterium]